MQHVWSLLLMTVINEFIVQRLYIAVKAPYRLTVCVHLCSFKCLFLKESATASGCKSLVHMVPVKLSRLLNNILPHPTAGLFYCSFRSWLWTQWWTQTHLLNHGELINLFRQPCVEWFTGLCLPISWESSHSSRVWTRDLWCCIACNDIMVKVFSWQ